jgi:hypothetical protein
MMNVQDVYLVSEKLALVPANISIVLPPIEILAGVDTTTLTATNFAFI